MGIELALMAVGGALMGGTISAATGGDFGKGMLMGALTGGIGVGITRAIDMTTGSGGGLLGKNEPSSSASTPSADTASSTTKALTVQQLQAGNSNVSNTMGGYTSNTLNTARGRLLNI